MALPVLPQPLSVDALRHEGCLPGDGPILVSGASGGLGSIALRILAKLGYEVHAVTGKMDLQDWLLERGAHRVIDRMKFAARSEKSLLRPEYAGSVDTVGGDMLHQIIRRLRFGGTAVACGMVGGTEISTNIYPFILRGIKLIGIASADSSLEKKAAIWEQLAGPWSIPDIMDEIKETGLEGLSPEIDRILDGKQNGRVVLRLPQ